MRIMRRGLVSVCRRNQHRALTCRYHGHRLFMQQYSLNLAKAAFPPLYFPGGRRDPYILAPD